MNRPIQIDLEILRRKIESLCRDNPELLTDDEFKHDVIEGETHAFELLERLSDNILAEKQLQDGIAERISDLKMRKSRAEMREAAYRGMAMKVMEVADLRRAKLAEATVSLSKSLPHVVIVDPSVIPDGYWRIKQEPNLTEIRNALKAGTDVPGASLSNQEDCLNVRTK